MHARRPVLHLADRVVACFAEPFGSTAPTSTSAPVSGVAVQAVGSVGAAERLLREADAAMCRHKRGHRSTRGAC
jgi:hypothetical protein